MSDFQKPPEFEYLTNPMYENVRLVTQPFKEDHHSGHRLHPDPPISYEYYPDRDAEYVYGRQMYFMNRRF